MALKPSIFLRGKLGKLILLLFVVMIFIHFVFLAIFAESGKTTQGRLNYDLMARQVTELIYTLQRTPPTMLTTTIGALDIPNISADIDIQASNKTRIDFDDPAWLILHSILEREGQSSIELSIRLPIQGWLNISANVVETPWAPEFILLLLELLVAATIFMSLWSINRFTGPLKKFRQAAERLGVDLDPEPLAEYGPSVVRDTAHAINQMQHRIRDLLRHRTQMLAGLSHDLRTPITRLKLRSQFIDDKTLQQKINNDLDEIETMVSDTLKYVRDEMRIEKKSKVDLNSLLESICMDFKETGSDISFKAETDEPMLKQANLMALKRAFSNLIVNALKYAGSAKVTIKKQKRHYLITVEDHGPGISDEHKEKVFDPFYRTETSRSRDTGGMGLGLAIVREVIQAHNGKITLHDATPRGLAVRVLL